MWGSVGRPVEIIRSTIDANLYYFHSEHDFSGACPHSPGSPL